MSPPRELLWGLFFEEIEVGDRLELGTTLEAAHVIAATGIFGDPGPNHLDEEHSSIGRFGHRVVPGPLSIGLMTGVLGQYFGQSIVALKYFDAEFNAPVYIGDTLRCLWTVVDKHPRAHLAGGGRVDLRGTGFVQRNSERVLCVSCTSTLAVGARSTLRAALTDRRG